MSDHNNSSATAQAPVANRIALFVNGLNLISRTSKRYCVYYCSNEDRACFIERAAVGHRVLRPQLTDLPAVEAERAFAGSIVQELSQYRTTLPRLPLLSSPRWRLDWLEQRIYEPAQFNALYYHLARILKAFPSSAEGDAEHRPFLLLLEWPPDGMRKSSAAACARVVSTFTQSNRGHVVLMCADRAYVLESDGVEESKAREEEGTPSDLIHEEVARVIPTEALTDFCDYTTSRLASLDVAQAASVDFIAQLCFPSRGLVDTLTETLLRGSKDPAIERVRKSLRDPATVIADELVFVMFWVAETLAPTYSKDLFQRPDFPTKLVQIFNAMPEQLKGGAQAWARAYDLANEHFDQAAARVCGAPPSVRTFLNRIDFYKSHPDAWRDRRTIAPEAVIVDMEMHLRRLVSVVLAQRGWGKAQYQVEKTARDILALAPGDGANFLRGVGWTKVIRILILLGDILKVNENIARLSYERAAVLCDHCCPKTERGPESLVGRAFRLLKLRAECAENLSIAAATRAPAVRDDSPWNYGIRGLEAEVGVLSCEAKLRANATDIEASHKQVRELHRILEVMKNSLAGHQDEFEFYTVVLSHVSKWGLFFLWDVGDNAEIEVKRVGGKTADARVANRPSESGYDLPANGIGWLPMKTQDENAKEKIEYRQKAITGNLLAARRVAAWIELIDSYRDIQEDTNGNLLSQAFFSYRHAWVHLVNDIKRKLEGELRGYEFGAFRHRFRIWNDVEVNEGEAWSERILEAFALSNIFIALETPRTPAAPQSTEDRSEYEHSDYCNVERVLAELRHGRARNGFVHIPVAFDIDVSVVTRVKRLIGDLALLKAETTVADREAAIDDLAVGIAKRVALDRDSYLADYHRGQRVDQPKSRVSLRGDKTDA